MKVDRQEIWKPTWMNKCNIERMKKIKERMKGERNMGRLKKRKEGNK